MLDDEYINETFCWGNKVIFFRDFNNRRNKIKGRTRVLDWKPRPLVSWPGKNMETTLPTQLSYTKREV